MTDLRTLTVGELIDSTLMYDTFKNRFRETKAWANGTPAAVTQSCLLSAQFIRAVRNCLFVPKTIAALLAVFIAAFQGYL